jgi:hypothetical protein
MENHNKVEMVNCCVKNCQKAIPKDEAIVIDGNYFCEICSVAYYRTLLNL